MSRRCANRSQQHQIDPVQAIFSHGADIGANTTDGKYGVPTEFAVVFERCNEERVDAELNSKLLPRQSDGTTTKRESTANAHIEARTVALSDFVDVSKLD